MKRYLIAGALALAAFATAACQAIPLTGNPAADAKAAAASVNANVGAAANPQQFFDQLGKFNAAAGQYCGGYGNIDWNPPLPPTGSLHLQCKIGQSAAPPDAADPAALKAAAGPVPAPPAK